MRAQSPAEFIIVTFLFLLLIISLFTTFVVKARPEFEKAAEQVSCLKANGLAIALLKEPGQPANWTADLQVLGFSNNTRDFVSYEKWLFAQNLGYRNVINKTVPDASYRLTYTIYAFSSNRTDTCPVKNNSAVICRFNETLLRINASISNTPATLNLKLFFPFSSAAQSDLTLEANDGNTNSISANGTTIELSLHTNSTDADALNITYSNLTKLIFIQEASYKTSGGSDLQIFVGNTSAVEVFGSAGTGANSYCEAERSVILVGHKNETFPTRFRILTW